MRYALLVEHLRPGIRLIVMIFDHTPVTLCAFTDEAQSQRSNQVEHVLGSHLERFGRSEPLTVTWQRSHA